MAISVIVTATTTLVTWRTCATRFSVASTCSRPRPMCPFARRRRTQQCRQATPIFARVHSECGSVLLCRGVIGCLWGGGRP
eukprot:2574823-Prymnesium_polylepis.1